MLHADQPVAGHYKTRLVRGGPWLPVRLWLSPPPDPETGEPLDRAPRWQAELAGKPVDDFWASGLWPAVALHPVDDAEYRYLCDLHHHAVQHEPELPEAAPRSPVDLRKLDPIF